jgi:hypothetical protein
MSEPIEFALKPGVQPGDSAFLFNRGGHSLAFDSFPGRTIALAFLGLAGDPLTDVALQALAARGHMVEGGNAAFFAVVPDSGSASWSTLETRYPSIRFLRDGEGLAKAFGVARAWVVLDRMLRVVDVAPLDDYERCSDGWIGQRRRARPSAVGRRRQFSRLPTFSSRRFAAISSTVGCRSRIAGSRSRSISTPISMAERFHFPNTAREASRPPPEQRSYSPPRSCTRCRG